MAELVLARVDSRLVHGQVLVKWTKQTQANSICIVDDEVAQDAMLIGMFKMAMPKGTTLEVLTAEEVAGFLSAQKGRVLLIFKDIAHAQTAIQTGVPVKDLQVAGLGRREGRIQVYPTVFLSEADAECLHSLQEKGIHVYFQALPEQKPFSLEDALREHFPSLLK